MKSGDRMVLPAPSHLSPLSGPCERRVTPVESHGEHNMSIYLLITNKLQVIITIFHLGRVQKFVRGKLVDFPIKWVGGVPLVH